MSKRQSKNGEIKLFWLLSYERNQVKISGTFYKLSEVYKPKIYQNNFDQQPQQQSGWMVRITLN